MEKRGEDRKGQERRGIMTEEEQIEGKVIGKRFGKGEGGGEDVRRECGQNGEKYSCP